MTDLNTIPAAGIDSAINNLLEGLFGRIRENNITGVYDSKSYENGMWLNRLEVFRATNNTRVVLVEQLTKTASGDGFTASDKLVAMSTPVKGGFRNTITDLNGAPYTQTPEEKQLLLSLLRFLSGEDTWTKVR